MSSLVELNSMSVEDFLSIYGNVIEHSPVVVLGAYYKRPFISRAHFIQALAKVLDDLPLNVKSGVLGIHPDLAGRLALQGQLTSESAKEQKAAGVADISRSQLEKINDLNRRYRVKFGFPFVICARLNKIPSIIEAMQRRLENDLEAEIQTGIDEVKKICEIRVKDLINENGEAVINKL